LNPKFRIRLVGLCMLALSFVIAASDDAGAFGHYTPGVEGLYAATLPPPGLHYLMYNVFYASDELKDDNGDTLDVGLDLNVYANAHRLAYVSKLNFFGANYGFDVIIPLINTDIKIEALNIDENKFGLGDICVEPIILGWHTTRWDLVAALGAYLPTGKHDTPSSPGFGYWSVMETFGATFYLDGERNWSASILTRWLQNTEDDDTDVTPGANMVAEWGIANTIPLNESLLLTGGVAGYSYVQLTKDSGAGASDDKYIAHAVGPEIRFMSLKPFPLQIILRYLFEYGSENTTEGHNASLVFTGSF
jgi:hypothetical protein